MRITADRKALLAAVTPAAKIIDPKSTVPILGHMLLEAEEGLMVTADSMDIRLAVPVPATVQQPGTITVDGKTLADIVRRLPEGTTVTIDATGGEGRAVLKAGRSRFTLPMLKPDEFPPSRREAWASTFTLPAGELRRTFENAAAFVIRDAARVYLEGVCMRRGEDDGTALLRFYATDTHRLFRFDRALPEGAESMPDVLLPIQACGEIARLAAEGDVTLQVGERMVAFTFAGGTTLTTKVIEGTYPDCERIIPRGHSKRVVVDRAALLEALDRVTAVTMTRSAGAKLTFEPERLQIDAASEKGDVREEVEVETDAAIVIGFNAQYLRDTLGVLDADRITVMLEQPTNPAVLTAFESQTPLCLVSPVKVAA